jgi:hypothetical protein
MMFGKMQPITPGPGAEAQLQGCWQGRLLLAALLQAKRKQTTSKPTAQQVLHGRL